MGATEAEENEKGFRDETSLKWVKKGNGLETHHRRHVVGEGAKWCGTKAEVRDGPS